MMVKQIYIVRFVTPAFLGDAEQNGAWRAPPFKALLRQWWRVAAAKDHGYDHAELRKTEGRLFGNTWLKDNFSQSQIKLRLDHWHTGKMSAWVEAPANVAYPEIKFPIDANLYLGYGPLIRNKEFRKTTLNDKLNAAIQAEESNSLNILYSDQSKFSVGVILQLIHWFGTIGGRSRNGWGSLFLEGDGVDGIEKFHNLNSIVNELAKPLKDCLENDWPHAFAKDQDNQLLIWKSKRGHSTWREAMVELAKLKIAFRTSLKFISSVGQIAERHLLAYPVTRHPIKAWGNQARLANQLRFKVTRTTQDYIAMVYHLPCGIPNGLLDALSKTERSWITDQQLGVWQSVHRILDAHMQRI